MKNIGMMVLDPRHPRGQNNLYGQNSGNPTEARGRDTRIGAKYRAGGRPTKR